MNSPYSLEAVEAFVSRFYKGANVSIVPYGYTVSVIGLAQNTQQTITVPITSNADFFLLSFNHRANVGAAQNALTKTAPFVRMLITDTGSNEQFTNAAVDLENYSTNTNVNQSLPYPRILSGRTALTIQFTNYAPTAETYALDVYLEGVLVRVYD